MQNLENKVVWITGASSGIGEAVAKQFALNGSKLVLSARRTSELERVKHELKLEDDRCLILTMDIEKQEQFENLIQTIIHKFGTIDLLFNNAGISQRSSVNETSMEVYRQLLEVNFFGVVALTKAVMPIMKKNKSGHIVVTSSVSGKLGTPMRSRYCASKHALHGFFDSLRAELVQENIKVTLICPGYINTNISLNALTEQGEKHGQKDNNQANGISSDEYAKQIIKAIKQDKSEVYIGKKEVIGVYLKRFFPQLLERIIIGQMPK